MSSFSPWGGLGELEEACVKWGGKESTLGAHAPTRRIRPKKGATFQVGEGKGWSVKNKPRCVCDCQSIARCT